MPIVLTPRAEQSRSNFRRAAPSLRCAACIVVVISLPLKRHFHHLSSHPSLLYHRLNSITMARSNPLFAIVWLLLLIFIAWPVAFVCAGIWLILQPFESLFKFIKSINNFLEKLVTWPRDCGHGTLRVSNPVLHDLIFLLIYVLRLSLICC
jgi:hypothetical protein